MIQVMGKELGVLYSEDVQEVLKYAWCTLVNEMILNVGWCHGQKSRTTWKTNVWESLMLANAALDAVYAEWKIAQVQLLKDQTNVVTFFMHKRNDKGLVMRWFGNVVFEKFHLNFWYTQMASPVKTFSDNYRTTLTYMIEYCSTYKAYHEGFLEALQHAVIGPVLTSHLAWLNKQGM
ncbi:hypothetical protein PISMIDRAFT_25088 [Pisolithus microcarpus 441]|uniref:Uncharacterized protein n=1 Tax=Pisolithus microcarpus 441 TaxID=765257 RepID=A0A0C9XW18_9AGAM|nr:hypothetical protein BKA83DRAFT_25088 [Pisolithus microcarpus]KIK16620.1 hypothetical protein PISMIDRAFT_25088 [Pisolithus microcarpus 441]